MARFTRTDTPLLEPVLVLLLGILVGSQPERPGDFRLAAGLFGLLLAIVIGLKYTLFSRIGNWRRIGMWIGFYALGIVLVLLHRPDPTPVQALHGSRGEWMARIESSPEHRGRWYRSEATLFCYADSLSGDWIPLGDPRIRLYISVSDPIGEPPRIGDLLRFRGRLYASSDTVAYDRYMLRTRSLVGRCFAYRTTLLDHAPTWRGRIESFRQRLGERLNTGSTDSTGGTTALLQALTLGRTSGLDPELRARYARTGLAHLLSVSGLHVGIIFLILNLLFGWIRLFRNGCVASGLLVIAALFGYALLTGLSPSVVRAVVMFSLLQIGLMLSRSTNSLNTLCAAALVLLLWNPYLLYHIGFQLSFAATAAIVTLYPPLARRWMPRWPVLRWLWSLTLVGLTAQLGVFPLILYHFGQIQPGGLLLNPIVWFTVPTLIVGSVVYLASGWSWLAVFLHTVAGWQNRLVEQWAAAPWIAWEELEISVWSCIALYLPVIVLIRWLNRSDGQRLPYSSDFEAARRDA